MDTTVIKTAGRVLEVLEYFREQRRPLSVREIAERFSYPLSSASVLVKSIATLGYLSYDQQLRAYFPTLRVAALGEWIYDALLQGGHIRELLEEIARATGETVLLAIQNDLHAQYVHVVPSSQTIQFNLPVGTKRLLVSSGAGWSLLAAQDDAAVEKIFHRTLQRLPDDPAVQTLSLPSLLESVRRTRANGYSFSRNTVTSGAATICMNLPVKATGARLAVTVAGVVERMDRNEQSIVKALREGIGRHA